MTTAPRTGAALALLLASAACATTNPDDIQTSADGAIITDLKAAATGGGSPFDGTVDSAADLDALVETAWGDGSLDLHRGHAPIEAVLEAFLGITHDEMHVLMEELGLNLAGVCQRFGFDPENLIKTLKFSFVPYLQEGVQNGVITEAEVEAWTAKIRAEFSRRVYWDGT